MIKYLGGILIGIVSIFGVSFSYTPSADLVEKVDSVVEKIELLIHERGESVREMFLDVLFDYESKSSNNERSLFIIDYIVTKISVDAVRDFNYQYVTPFQPEGPYYPIDKPADVDNDLTRLGNGVKAEGDILEFSGRVGYLDGTVLEGGTVEIWQTDARAVYLHPGDSKFPNRDVDFQFYGESIINENGEYSFTTISPGEYDARPAHIHLIVVGDDGKRLHTTQIYFEGDLPQTNGLDGLSAGIGDGFDMLIMEVTKQGDKYVGLHDIVLP